MGISRLTSESSSFVTSNGLETLGVDEGNTNTVTVCGEARAVVVTVGSWLEDEPDVAMTVGEVVEPEVSAGRTTLRRELVGTGTDDQASTFQETLDVEFAVSITLVSVPFHTTGQAALSRLLGTQEHI